MKPHTKHIKGSLMPSNAYGITETTAARVRKVVTDHNLSGIIKKNRWDFGIIDINSVTLATRDFSDIDGFLRSLDGLIRDERVADLGLQGELMIAVETVGIEPIMYRVTVSKGEISVQRGAIVWT